MLPVHWYSQRGHSESQRSQSSSSDPDILYHDAVDQLVEDQPAVDETSVSESQAVTAPPTSPTRSPLTISSPEEVMEQLLHHHLEDLESKRSFDDPAHNDAEGVHVHVHGHSSTLGNGSEVAIGDSTSEAVYSDGDNALNKEEEAVPEESVESEAVKAKLPSEGKCH